MSSRINAFKVLKAMAEAEPIAWKYVTERAHLRQFAAATAVQFNNRLKLTAGVTKFYKSGEIVIELNPRMTDEQARHTFLHELAHVFEGPEAGHGEAWAERCRDLGINPDVHHRFEQLLATRAKRKPVGRCRGCGHIFYRRCRYPKGAVMKHPACGGFVDTKYRGEE